MDEAFRKLLGSPSPILALAPMQDVTDLPFLRLMARYGGADFYVTEYFRVHGTSKPEKSILRSITENPTGRPVVAQLIGNDVEALVRTAKVLQRYPIAAVDLNLGCPAPVVYRKCAGGGLLRDPALVDRILGALREAVQVPFTVKTRVGFDSPGVFEQFLKIFGRHSIDLLTVHGRTVKEMYRSGVHYDLIARAVEAMPCPVVANGDVSSAAKAFEVLKTTGAKGVMIGRWAIRSPWLFDQIRQRSRGEEEFVPTGADVLNYIRELYEAVRPPVLQDLKQVQKMKKYMNFIASDVGDGTFQHAIRRVTTEGDFFRVCEEHLGAGVGLIQSV